MPYSKIKLISFDLDNTLYDNQPVINLADQKSKEFLSQEFSKQNKKFDYSKLKKIKYELVVSQQKTTNSFHYDNLSRLREDALLIFCNELDDGSNTAQKALDIFLNYRSKVEIDQEIKELLISLSKKYQLVSVTNGNCDAKKLSIGDLFLKNYSPVEGFRAKPHPQMLNQILIDFNLKPEQVLHLGDREDSDGLAAKKAGCHYYQIDPFINGELNKSLLVKFLQELKIQ